MRYRYKEAFGKKDVYDSTGMLVGHVDDMAFSFGPPHPEIVAVAVHMPWTEQIGPYRLVRPVDDIVLLLPWRQVTGFDEERVMLEGEFPSFDLVTAEGLLFLKQDVIDKQIVDDEGNRLQRVDDVILSDADGILRVETLYLGMTWLPSGIHLKKVLERLTREAKAVEEVDEIPWELVGNVDRDTDILTLKPLVKP
ncbi:MAG: hypothetical protein C4521_01035 [Actinobacteria bacterium]|nr:MAG: hypothetical protein C4521_01035 [Actinomycetota bacterium]